MYYNNEQENKDIKEENKDTHIIIICPHCNEFILIEQLNCAIFRHGVLIKSGKQINPHASKELCDYYIKHNKIYGCGKPYQIIIEDNQYKAIICDYI
jgi:hypothetical protein